jgi:hypothetical protein
MAATPSGRGYWLVARDGGVFTFGDAGFYGAVPGVTRDTAAGLQAAPDGAGYLVIGISGTAYSFGDAPKLPSLDPAIGARDPIIGLSGHRSQPS